MIKDYYANVNVRARMLEFLGGNSPDNVTSVYITADDCSADVRFAPRSPRSLWQYLDKGLDLGRSLWDHRSLIAHLDIEYVNFDSPAYPYLEPLRCFDLQRPVVHAIQEVLFGYGITPLHLLSGRGHHFAWQIDRRSPAFESLAKIGRFPDSLVAKYAQLSTATSERVDSRLGAAFAGLGLVMEFVTHRVLEASVSQCAVPVMVTAVEAGPGIRGREVVSIDLSEYGDPLHTRGIRVPFSTYLKPYQQRWLLGDVVDALPLMFMIPLHENDDRQGLFAMRDVGQVIELAQGGSVQIPDQSLATESLIAEYNHSKLAPWHDYFYSAQHDPCDTWPRTYDRTPLKSLPPCARCILEHPNERLLKPAGIQHVVRILLAVGWHPRHIAGLIRSKYERDFGWGGKWYYYDAATRADFYVRLFAGLSATGHDDLVDLNCRSCQEKRYCPGGWCSDNLLGFRDRLLARRDKGEARFLDSKKAIADSPSQHED
jgi:hypothetical protein